MTVRFVSIILFGLFGLASAQAQDVFSFPREDFGKVILSQKQFASTGDAMEEARIGHYNNEPISRYSSNSIFARLGRPVGRLDILTDVGVFPCTAFVVSDKYLLTNHHCVPGIVNQRTRATRIEAVQLVLGYVQEGIEEGTKRYNVSTVPVETDKKLDYSLLEVFGKPSDEFGTVKLANAESSDRYPYWIIGHPMGEAQRISRENCQSASPAVAAERLRHLCDTLPGNSGSPVIDPDSRAAVAIHHAGSQRNSINYAIPLQIIAKRSNKIASLIDRAPALAPAPVSVAKLGDTLILSNNGLGPFNEKSALDLASVQRVFSGYRAKVETFQAEGDTYTHIRLEKGNELAVELEGDRGALRDIQVYTRDIVDEHGIRVGTPASSMPEAALKDCGSGVEEHSDKIFCSFPVSPNLQYWFDRNQMTQRGPVLSPNSRVWKLRWVNLSSY